MTKICVWCKNEINNGEEYNFIMRSYSHKSCDQEQFGKIDKNIIVAKKVTET